MKKVWMVLLLAGLFATAVFADGEIPVQEHQLPDAVRGFIHTYFGDTQVAEATKGTGVAPVYDVIFSDGSTAAFNARGEWLRVARPGAGVPAELLPRRAARYIAENNPDVRIESVEREGRGCMVWLDNGLGLRFDRRGEMTGF